VPVAELVAGDELLHNDVVRNLGPDPLADNFRGEEAIERMQRRDRTEIADVLLDQSVIAGIGNVFKSEVLFGAQVNPFTPVGQLTQEQLAQIVAVAVRFMRANVGVNATGGIVTYTGMRRTTGRSDPSARLWVYGRGGQPCRRCGTPISRQKQGPFARSTYWCSRCQEVPAVPLHT
jgi:endonuclease-8